MRLMRQSDMKILFVARTYPPFVGGMEKFASDFYHHLQEVTDVDILANHHGKRRIIQFFFKALFHLIWNAHKYDLIHFNDAVLSPLIPIIRLVSKTKVTMTVHGLDIVFERFGYQYLIVPFIKYADRIFPVSEYTKQQCLMRGVPENKLRVIPNGLDFDKIVTCTEDQIAQFLSKLNIPLENKHILLSLGRLINRKGHGWFIENVMQNLPENYIYLIAGDGREYDSIQQKITDLQISDRVIMLGFVSEIEKACLFQIADLFLMPNIYEENDQEGFGIVLLEAGSYELPSIAANIEGIRDAVIEGVTGHLVEEKNPQAFIEAITHFDIDRGQIAQTLRDHYDWQIISKTYLDEFSQLLQA